jgi:hypothetical protein
VSASLRPQRSCGAIHSPANALSSEVGTPPRIVALHSLHLPPASPHSTLSYDVDMSIGTLEPTTLPPHKANAHPESLLSLGYPKICLETIVNFLQRIPLGSVMSISLRFVCVHACVALFSTGSHVLRPFQRSSAAEIRYNSKANVNIYVVASPKLYALSQIM